jgi:hypothetical protein
MAAPVDRIFAACQALLDGVVANHGADLPDRQYVAAGPPAWDCELLAAWCEGTAGTGADPGNEANAAGAAWAMRVGTFVLTLVRCMPPAELSETGDVLTLPTTDEETAAAQVLYEDAQRLLNAVVATYRAGDLPGCHGVSFLAWTVLGPAGNLVAGELRVAIKLTGA